MKKLRKNSQLRYICKDTLSYFPRLVQQGRPPESRSRPPAYLLSQRQMRDALTTKHQIDDGSAVVGQLFYAINVSNKLTLLQ